MNKRRLLKWAAFLDKVPKEKFEMGTWGDPKGGYMGKRAVCATRACALGWATAIPAFRRAGLGLYASEGAGMADVIFDGLEGTDACERFFGISYSDADDLCHGGGSTPKRKAAEIRALVRRNASRF